MILLLIHILPLFFFPFFKLFIIDHNQVDWRIAMTSNRVLGISLELIVCAIHPVAIYLRPDIGGRLGAKPEQNASTPLCLSSSHKEVMLDVELLLSALMFLRLYLVHRAVLLHSKVLLSASYRSIGSLNNINFSFRFVLKVLMNKYPARTLLVFIMFFWLSAAWMLRLCERYTERANTSREKHICNRIYYSFFIRFLSLDSLQLIKCYHADSDVDGQFELWSFVTNRFNSGTNMLFFCTQKSFFNVKFQTKHSSVFFFLESFINSVVFSFSLSRCSEFFFCSELFTQLLSVSTYRQKQVDTGGMDTALWLIAITFLTVGYGDVSPHTSCGKLVCLFTGVMVNIIHFETNAKNAT